MDLQSTRHQDHDTETTFCSHVSPRAHVYWSGAIWDYFTFTHISRVRAGRRQCAGRCLRLPNSKEVATECGCSRVNDREGTDLEAGVGLVRK